MAESTDFFWRETFSSIYPVLGALEREGMIVKTHDSSKGKRARHLYALAPKGQQVLQEWLKESPMPHQVRSEILLKLFLGSLASPNVSLQHVQKHREELTKKKRTLSKIREELLCMSKDTVGLPYWLITLDHGMKTIDASLQWCEETVVKLKEIGANHE